MFTAQQLIRRPDQEQGPTRGVTPGFAFQSQPRLRIGLVVASYGRPELVRQLLLSLKMQVRAPDAIVLSVVSEKDFEPEVLSNPKVNVVYSLRGSCAQRNAGLAVLQDGVDLVLFIDDDFWMSSTYIRELEQIFLLHHDIVAATGLVLADGATTAGISVVDAEKCLEDYMHAPPRAIEVRDVPDTYGCNMAFRASEIGDLRFDEKLPLYGWQEDVDFSAQLRGRGRIVATNLLWGVHLGAKKGKVSGMRFGYSQVINPLYIVGKGNMALPRALFLISKNLFKNVLRSPFPEQHIDRWGRLKGNVIGLFHAVAGKLDPMYALKL